MFEAAGVSPDSKFHQFPINLVTWAFATALGALLPNPTLVAFLLSKCSAVGPFVIAGRYGCDWRVRWPVRRSALGHHHRLGLVQDKIIWMTDSVFVGS